MSIIRAWSSLAASVLKKYNWRPDSEIEMLKIGNRNIRGAAASEGGTSLLDFFLQFLGDQLKKRCWVNQSCIEK